MYIYAIYYSSVLSIFTCQLLRTTFRFQHFNNVCSSFDRHCVLVIRVLDYRSRGPGSIPADIVSQQLLIYVTNGMLFRIWNKTLTCSQSVLYIYVFICMYI
jgi:hypothetical protein